MKVAADISLFPNPQVWSLVALIYNNWMIYLPTYAERDEGMLKTPVMCSTTRWVGEYKPRFELFP